MREVSEPIDIMMIGDHAGLSEFSSRVPFVGPDGSFLRQSLREAISNKAVAYTYLVRGWPVDENSYPEYKGMGLHGAKPNYLARLRTISLSTHPELGKIVSYCFPNLAKDIAKFRPKQLIVMGNTVLKMLFPAETRPLSSLTEEVLFYNGIPTRVIANPVSVMKNPSSRIGWVKKAIHAINNTKEEKSEISGQCQLLTTVKECLEYIDYLKNNNLEIAFDTETKNLNKRYGNKLATMQFATNGDSGVVIPYAHWETPFSPEELDTLKPALRSLFGEPSKIKSWICHNAKFECNILANTFGVQLFSAPIFDAQIGAFLLDENRSTRRAEFKYGPYTLKQLAIDYLNFDGYDSGILAAREEGKLWDLPLKELAEYGCMDSYITWLLKEALVVEAVNQGYSYQLHNLMYSFFNTITLLFSDIERIGSPVDRQAIRKLIGRESPLLTVMTDVMTDLKKTPEVKAANRKLLASTGYGLDKVTPLLGEPWIFDFAKTGHPQALFFDVCRLTPRGPKGASGLYSVDGEWQDANVSNPLVQKFQDWGAAKKMYDSFATKLYARVDPATGDEDCKDDTKIRPSYFIANVVTGRVACRDPNLQAIPRGDSPVKKMIKDCFNSLPGNIMIQLDFKANEMRWVGIAAQDYAMAENFLKGKRFLDEYRKNPDDKEKLKLAELYGDIHRQNASKAFGIPIEQVSKDQRQKAKGISFGVLYDSSEKAIADMYGLDQEEVTVMFRNFYNEYPSIYNWKMEMKRMAVQKSYVEAPHGRRRRFPIFDFFRPMISVTSNGISTRDVPSEYRAAVGDALRQASNAPIQGIASDAGMIGAAIFQNYARINKPHWLVQNAVHDSGVFQVPYSDLEEALVIAERCFTTDVMEYMGNVFDINFILPIEVDFELGALWGSLKGWKYDFRELPEIVAKVKEFKGE